MKTITKKGDLKNELDLCLSKITSGNINSFVEELNHRILRKKVKFPLLEYCASEINMSAAEQYHVSICDQISALRTIGGNVIIGILLQKRLADHFEESMKKSIEYIAIGGEWYVTDIIGERIYGWSLLHFPAKTLQLLKKLSSHTNHWVVRSIGPGLHYAIKKGLQIKYVEKVFALLLTLATAKDYHVKRGIGWAAKTTAKFHPEVIEKYAEVLENKEEVGQWFRTKVNIGLKRNAYAKTH